MSEREFWSECIRDVILDLQYDPEDYDSYEDFFGDLENDIDNIIDRLDLDVYLDGRGILTECLKEYYSIELCFKAISDEKYATKLVIDSVLYEVAYNLFNNYKDDPE